jgi:hypothetical protein
MTTSQTSFLSEILGSEAIPPGKLAYFRGRLSNAIHSLVLAEFARLENEGLITRAELARRIGRRPEQVTRWLGSAGNWTIDTFSDLLLAMKCEPSVSLTRLANAATHGNLRSDRGADSVTEVSFIQDKRPRLGSSAKSLYG